MRSRTLLGLGLITASALALSCLDARATSKSGLQSVCKELGGVFQDKIPGGGYACTVMDGDLAGLDIKCDTKGKCDTASPAGVAPPRYITDALRGGKPTAGGTLGGGPNKKGQGLTTQQQLLAPGPVGAGGGATTSSSGSAGGNQIIQRPTSAPTSGGLLTR
jgi:hypothetical protein